MLPIVFKNRLFVLLIGLSALLACQNEKSSPQQSSKSGKDSTAIFVNQKPKAPADIQATIQQFVKDEALQHASISISIIENSTGQEIANYQPQLSVIPASSLKVLPTATGLAVLGKDYRFKTEILHDGRVENGILNGNIYIKGYGDPTLGSDQMSGVKGLNEVMNDFANAVKNAGINSINGRVIADASWLPTAVNSPTWAWNDLGNYYASGAWGLNIHENLYYLNFQQNPNLGGQPKITNTSPDIGGLDWTNELVSGARGSGDNAYIYGAPYSNKRFVRGSIPLGSGTFKIKGSIPNPPSYAAAELYFRLKKIGLTPNQYPGTQLNYVAAPSSAKTLHTHQSPLLFEIAKRCNLKSVNLYAESILRAIGKQQSNKGDLQSSLRAMQSFWEQKGWDTKGLFLEDASGLSPRNAASAQHLSRFLYLVAQDPVLYPTFKNTLAVGGRTGTLKLMFKNTIAEGKIWGKSGSMSRIRSYVGYAKNRAGQDLSFAIIVNNYTCSSGEMRKKIERLMVGMCE